MILTEFDAKSFLESTDGRILGRVRLERDWLAKYIKNYTSSPRSEECVDEMVGQETEWSGYATLLADFSGNHQWTCCGLVEALKLLCNRAAELERQACRQPAAK